MKTFEACLKDYLIKKTANFSYRIGDLSISYNSRKDKVSCQLVVSIDEAEAYFRKHRLDWLTSEISWLREFAEHVKL